MTAPNSSLLATRKAIALQNAFIGRGRDVRRHHHETLKALRLSEAFLSNGFDLDRVRLAIEAAGGERANALVPVTNQHFANHSFHSPETDGKALEADANHLHERAKILQGREDDDRRHR